MVGQKPIDGRHARSHSTRERILLAAERLFGEFGISNVSLRDISVAAGQKNNGAVQYHFGDRENLLASIVAYRAEAIEAVRAERLEAILARREQPEVRDFVTAVVDALSSVIDDDNYTTRFLSRLMTEHSGAFHHAVPRSSILFLRVEMRRLLPHVPEAVLDQRWKIVTMTTVHMLASYHAVEKAGTLPAPLPDLLDDLVNVLAAGLAAPLSPERPATQRGTPAAALRPLAFKAEGGPPR